VPTDIKSVGNNKKVGATVIIDCEFRTSTTLPPLIIFTGVYGTKLMQQWESFEEVMQFVWFSDFYFYSNYLISKSYFQ
jgi:hypothetical protein